MEQRKSQHDRIQQRLTRQQGELLTKGQALLDKLSIRSLDIVIEILDIQNQVYQLKELAS